MMIKFFIYSIYIIKKQWYKTIKYFVSNQLENGALSIISSHKGYQKRSFKLIHTTTAPYFMSKSEKIISLLLFKTSHLLTYRIYYKIKQKKITIFKTHSRIRKYLSKKYIRIFITVYFFLRTKKTASESKHFIQTI